MATKKKAAAPRGLPPLKIGLLRSDEEIEAIIAKRCDEEFERMTTLAESLNVKDGSARWYLVALHLARQHVPELMETKRQGAPTRWNPFALGLLAVAIERHTSAGKTVAQAADALACMEPWASFVGRQENRGGATVTPDPGEVLRRNYTQAKKESMAKIVHKGFKWHESNRTVDAWDGELPGYLAEITERMRRR
jgi:hypothetical protein